MSLVNAKCTNCGASLEIDNSKDAMICPHCNSAFIVEKAINNYNISNVTNVVNNNEIKADVVKIYNTPLTDFEIVGGVLKKYKGSAIVVEIPDTVIEIAGTAFDGGGGENKFKWVKEIKIPSSVAEIAERAFEDCINLERITVDGNNATFSSIDGLLCSKDGSKLLRVPRGKKGALTIPSGIKEIGEYAFDSSYDITEVTIPNSVTSIGNDAFIDCESLTNITIPNSVTSIGERAFSGCESLTNITIPNSVISIGKYAFNWCRGLTNVTIPNSVTSIGEYAFTNCESLTNVMIGSAVASIGRWVFSECKKLTHVTILDGVTSIGDDAFMDCKSLTNITIPNSVTNIGKCAFARCESLKRVTIPNGVTNIGERAFSGCKYITFTISKKLVKTFGCPVCEYELQPIFFSLPNRCKHCGANFIYNDK